ncbi:fibronectin type III domain-containing protein [Jonesiaceae bacterium BS-20]|uniref:Fibronectin type III domain-containing protein n=1 Tax=Jonesiaceae bacterium BS-20 TaxID=3120821 RepID=A0AAU7E088_9MICO
MKQIILTRLHALRRDAGQIAPVIVLSAIMALIGISTTAAVYMQIKSTNIAIDDIATVQRTDAAVADGLDRLSAGQSLPVDRANAVVSCQLVQTRPVCFEYWALPNPGNAVDPTKYDLIVNTWADPDRDNRPPSNPRDVRTHKIQLEAASYQTGNGSAPSNIDGKIVYEATPKALFGNAIHGFSSVLLNGPDGTVTGYNSITGANTPSKGIVSTSGWAMYGSDITVGQTTLYGSQDNAGTITPSRCTGDACEDSGITTAGHTYAKATAESVAWMGDLTCTERIEGNWIASEHNGTITANTLCVEGNFIIDMPTVVAAPKSRVVIKGATVIQDSLNTPGQPGSLIVYSQGQTVTFNATAGRDPGLGISAMIFAPRAACTSDPGSNQHVTNYFGSLVCDTVSLGGEWTHAHDEAAVATLTNDVPASANAWTVGPYTKVDGSDKWDSPTDWETNQCPVPAPVSAASHWRLSESAGLLAADSTGRRDATWASSFAGRASTFCGTGAQLTPGGQVSSTQAVHSTSGNVTIEWWGKGTVGTIANTAGVTIDMDSTGHIAVTSGGKKATLPFTVQNATKTHLYTVTVTSDGTTTLHVNGALKATATTAAPAGGPTTIADGTAGVMHNVAVYTRALTQTEISARWAKWNEVAEFDVTNPGTPFTAPTNVTDNNSTGDKLSLHWDAPTGTFPDDSLYTVQSAELRTDPYSDVASVKAPALTLAQQNPEQGDFWYRVCATYNGDTQCSDPVNILTIPEPTTPPVHVASATQKTVTFNWTEVPGSKRYEYRYRIDRGNWSAPTSAATNVTATVTSPTGDTRIDLQMRVLNGPAISNWSPMVTGYVTPSAPAPAVKNVTMTTADIQWAAIPHVTEYTTRHRVNGGQWVTGTTATPDLTLKSLSANQRVELQVQSINPSGVSTWSTTLPVITQPSAPVVRTGTATTTSAPFLWDPIANATKYETQSRINGGNWANTDSTTSTHTTITHEGKPNTLVELRVRTVNPTGTSDWSEVAASTVKPSAPTVEVTDTTATTVTFGWGAIPNAASYEYRYKINASSWSGALTNSSALTRRIDALSNNDSVEFQVRTVNQSGTSDWSTSVHGQAAPLPPEPAFASGSSTGTTFTWNAVPNATGYEYQYKTNTGAWTKPLPVKAGPTQSIDELGPNTKIEFQVRTLNKSGVSTWSSSATGYTLPTAPQLRESGHTDNSVDLAWDHVAYATNYEYRYLTDGQWSDIQTTEEPAVILEGLEQNSTISVEVFTVNAAGTSQNFTALKTHTTPQTPEFVHTESTQDSATFEWEQIPGVTDYQFQFKVNSGEWNPEIQVTDYTKTLTGLNASDQITARVQAVGPWSSSPWSLSSWSQPMTVHTTPSAPVVKLKTMNEAEPTFEWTEVPGATAYEVQYSINNGESAQETAAETTTEFTVQGAQPGQTVLFEVRVITDAGTSDWSATAEVRIPPAAPTVQHDESSSSAAEFSWQNVASAEHYEYQYMIDNGRWTPVTTIETPFLIIDDLQTDQSVRVRVRTVDDQGTISAWSTEVIGYTSPSAPSNLLGDLTNPSTAEFTWDSVPHATGYEVQYLFGDTDTGQWVQATVSEGERTFTVNDLPASQDVNLSVRTVSPGGTSEWSDAVTALTLPDAPVVTVPDTGVSASAIPFEWTHVSDAEWYEYRTSKNDGPWSAPENVELDESITIEDLTEDQKITIEVRAVNAAGPSPWSAPASGYTSPSTPLNLAGFGTPFGTIFEWQPVPHSTHYEVRYLKGGESGDWVESVTPDDIPAFIIPDSVDDESAVQLAVRAISPGGESSWSEVAVTDAIPGVPDLGQPDTESSETSINFTWAPIPGISWYEYQYKINDGDWSPVLMNGTETSVTINELQSNDHVMVQVRAVNEIGSSAWSDPVLRYTAPQTPVGSLVQVTATQAVFTWEPVSSALGYEYQTRTGDEPWSAPVATTEVELVEAGPVEPETLTRFRVRAVGLGGTGAWSEVVRATTTQAEEPEPGPPVVDDPQVWNKLRSEHLYWKPVFTN